ncbi:MAG: TIGR02206 family membrane protein [Acholeplasmataceae bacterium]|nr:TIGR02206 family membrane protein [Acholeplasmataceae bacterium]
MFNEAYNNQLTMFNLLHFITLLGLLTMFICVFMFKDKLIKPKNDALFRYILGCLLLIFEAGYHIWVLSRNSYEIDMIPLTGFCAMTNLLTIYALLFSKHHLFNYIIYYAFTGALFALLFVDTTYGPPHFRYFHYFVVHFGFLLASLYYFVTNRIELKLKNLLIAALSLFTYTIFVLIVDLVLDKNWFYLFESPVKEISDAFGSPWYTILWILSIIILTVIWYVLLRIIKRDNK